WPNAAPPPSAPSPLPAVPTLILDGDADLRTPLEDARSVGARIPGSQVVGIPFTGHSVLGSDLSDCSAQAVAAFFGGGAIPPCHAQELFKPTPVAPTSLARLPGRSKADRTLNALRATLNDVRRQFLGDAVAAGRATPNGSRAAGLRSGSALWTSTGIRLRRVEYVPGVIVSGFAPHSTTARASFTLAGRSAARGEVRVTGNGRVSGRLDGQAVSGRFVTAAGDRGASAAGPVWPQRLPRYPVLARVGG
ncbi:MAG TPA: alpha/beta hydrolase, partial [Solirubrobacteraceae bacterium]|nr:alpha/beta hydrolase [Solirubrobacteraceae bacterium]